MAKLQITYSIEGEEDDNIHDESGVIFSTQGEKTELVEYVKSMKQIVRTLGGTPNRFKR